MYFTKRGAREVFSRADGTYFDGPIFRNTNKKRKLINKGQILVIKIIQRTLEEINQNDQEVMEKYINRTIKELVRLS